MTIARTVEPRTRRDGRVLILVGAVCGVAWAAALRGFMAEVAGAKSTFSWLGTFGMILVPGMLVGGLFGWAEHLRRTDDRRRRGRLGLAPLIFALDPGALVVVLPAMAGGWALAGKGSRGVRWAAGTFALLPVPAYAVAAIFLPGLRELATPRGLWIAILLFSLLAVLTLACAIPHRAAAAGPQS